MGTWGNARGLPEGARASTGRRVLTTSSLPSGGSRRTGASPDLERRVRTEWFLAIGRGLPRRLQILVDNGHATLWTFPNLAKIPGLAQRELAYVVLASGAWVAGCDREQLFQEIRKSESGDSVLVRVRCESRRHGFPGAGSRDAYCRAEPDLDRAG